MGMRNTKTIISALMVTSALTITACSTVRDTTDWIPGVDSNEEVQAEEKKEAEDLAAKERETYQNKAAFAPTAQNASTSDATISVNIGQQFETVSGLNRENVGIEVDSGVVTLTGSVSSADSAVNAISIAKSSEGVSRVVSKLVIVNVRSKGKIQVELPVSTSVK